jgi:WD40 repeat protein
VTDGSTLRILRGHEKRVNSVAWSPDGHTLASASWDATVQLWQEVGADLRVCTLRGHTSAVFAVAWSPEGHTLASAAWDRTVRLWRVADE